MGGQMPRAPFPPNVTQWIRLVTCAFTVLDAISLSLSRSLTLSLHGDLSRPRLPARSASSEPLYLTGSSGSSGVEAADKGERIFTQIY